ncbi:MAG: SPOR domain-containing protein [Paludibacteraceae bacterium]
MKTNWGILILSILLIIGITSCKSKQKVVEITGAQIEAAEPAANNTQTKITAPDAALEKEVTRNEKFSLADGQTNVSAFNNKYHVVVGSFAKKDNAIRLQSTLVNEGNNALVVINEDGLYRVIVASYNEYSKARNHINMISNRFPDAWVLIQK